MRLSANEVTATSEDPLESFDLDGFVDLSGGRKACLKRVDHPGLEIDGNPAKGSRVSCSSPTYVLQAISIAGRHGMPLTVRRGEEGNMTIPLFLKNSFPSFPALMQHCHSYSPKVEPLPFTFVGSSTTWNMMPPVAVPLPLPTPNLTAQVKVRYTIRLLGGDEISSSGGEDTKPFEFLLVSDARILRFVTTAAAYNIHGAIKCVRFMRTVDFMVMIDTRPPHSTSSEHFSIVYFQVYWRKNGPTLGMLSEIAL